MNYQDVLKRWDKLPLREKRVLALGSLVVIILIAYALIWAPIANKTISLREQIVKDGKLLAWMQAANTRIETMKKHLQPTASKSSKSLLGLIQDEINQSPFAKNVTGLRQAEKDSIQLNLNNVPFDEMTKWLIQIWQKQGLQVVHMNVVPAGETGIVKAEIELKG